MSDAQRLGDRYELGEELGRGGMAEVHLGRDLRLGRTVAIKTLRADLARDPTFQARFRREAQSAASLNHPAVVAVYDTGEDQVNGVHLPYIVMEYVEGQTLRELMNDGRRLLPERALEITAGVLNALEYSHRAGIVHRDIKPANVMLSRHGDIKVMDFGIARAVADSSATMTQTAAVIGTAQYLSPEQARGASVDNRSDLYSTGCLLYELLTGRPPFLGDSAVAVAYQHVREDPVPPSQLDPDISEAVDAIVMKALAKSPDDRYQDAAEMRADIERALSGHPVTAPAVYAGAPDSTQVMSATTALPPVRRDEEDGGRRKAGYVLLGIAVLAVFVLAALLGRQIFGGSDAQRVEIPSLVGKTQNVAERLLRDKGLDVGEVSERFSKEPRDTVIGQKPEAGAFLASGGSVDLTVSKGPQQGSVPDVVGMSQDEAEKALEKAGLRVGQVTSEDSAKREDEVLDSNPSPGSSIDRGASVDLTVASGSNAVPNVIGQSASTAAQILKDAGFDVKTEETETDQAPDGQVFQQSVPAGESRDLGSTVIITVATQPAQPEPAPTETEAPPSETASPSPTPTTTVTVPTGG